jgi:hypothetical protein
MKTFSSQQPVPAAVVTAATMDTNIQPVLFSTQYGYRDKDTSVREDVPLKWVIRSLRVTLVRDWNICQAQITLTTSIPSRGDRLPPLPNLYKYRKGNYPYLSKDDEIRIYAGYIDSHTTPICVEMLDERSMDLCPGGGGGWKHDPEKPLCPIFWGFVDTIHCVGSSEGGVQLILQCRDRMRVLADTKILSIPSLIGSKRDTRTKGGATGRRDEIIYDIYRATTSQLYVTGGDDTAGEQKCWKKVYGAYKDGRRNNEEEEDGGLLYTAYIGAGDVTKRDPTWKNSNADDAPDISPEEDPALWLRKCTHSIMRPDASPRLSIWVQRPPLQKSHMAATFQVYKRSPLEVLMYLASQEERVTDFYASHINGDYVFGPRVLDTSGFDDPHRMHRTYFFRTVPDCIDRPLPNQMVLSLRSSSTSVASFNRLVIVNPEANGGNRSFLDSIQLTMEFSTFGAEGRAITPPCRTQIVEDAALSTYGNPLGGAVVTALSTARLWGRDIEGVELTVLGDPTLYPSEAIKLWGSVLHDEGTSVVTGTDESLKELEKEQLKAQLMTEDISLQKPKDKPVDISTLVDIKAGRTLTTNKGNDPSSWVLPVYKVRLVQHILSTQGADEGFITRIRAVADY